ncbi:Na(+)/citrate cotransporter-like [Rhopilema esculentum]|uniref:Na(+)/citrate cotransporter-like n=1 Tax=Rhopilema esculentum TaxID=499914 RepID=UPI0031D506D1|eukprot:gene15343-6567_t
MTSISCRSLKRLREWRTLLIIFLTPLVLSPLPLIVTTKEARTAYAILIMGIYWCTEVTNLTVTALLPLFLFPVLRVLPAKDIAPPYFKDTNILVLGGLMMAVAIERWNLHKRISLKVLLLIGTSPRRLMLGFMIVTAFISMWITNTATTAMMTPIMEAVLKKLDEELETQNKSSNLDNLAVITSNEPPKTGDETRTSPSDATEETHLEAERGEEEMIEMASPFKTYRQDSGDIDGASDDVRIVIQESSQEDEERRVKQHKTLCVAMTLCICYAANIGGTGSLTGTTPQQILAGQLTDVFKDSPGMSFLSWGTYAFPEMVIFLIIAWIYLQAMFFGISWKHLCCCFRGKKRNKTKGKEVYALMKQQYAELGPITFAEYAVFGHFLALVLSWILRDPKFIPGWGALFPLGKKSYVSDSTAGVIISFSMFVFPSERPEILGGPRRRKPHTTLLEWKFAQYKFPWNVTLLLGSGFAIAKACEESGLSMWLGCQLAALSSVPNFVIVLVISILLTFLTEFTSNTATATILLPVLASLAQSIKVHPYYLMVPAAVCASFAFMLPIAGPSNAIVFSTGRITIFDMMKAGFGMNIIGIIIVNLSINTYGKAFFDLTSYPDWASSAVNKVQCGPVIPTTFAPTLSANATTMPFTSSVLNASLF